MGDDVVALMSGHAHDVPGMGSDEDVGRLHVSVYQAVKAHLDRKRGRSG